MKQPRVYAVEFKQSAVRRVLSGEPLSAVAGDIGGDLQRLYSWYKRARFNGLAALRAPGRPRKGELAVLTPMRGEASDRGRLAQRRIAELERKVGQQELDLDFFRQALRHVKARQQAAAGRGRLPSTKSSK